MIASIAMRFLGIDIGTSFLKSGLLDLDRLCVGEVHRAPFPLSNDPSVIVAAVGGLIAESPGVDGIVFCGQMHGLMLASRRGEPLADYIPWSDLRAEECFGEMLSRLTPRERGELGSELRPSLPVSFLYWMTRHGGLPEGAIPCSLADFVVASLCRAAPVAEPTS
ncbi:MAG: hypothetical protein HY822_03740, partial [Acidobacteria bacterium]|nr:hypothetical protein [Acidobacteriota bacterium]